VARRFFAAGCWVLVSCGLVHLLGHYALVTSTGDTDTERQMLELMRTYRRDMGLGFVRSTFDLLTGFSLAFSIQCLGFGGLGLGLMRAERGFPRVLRTAAGVYAVAFGAMTAMGFVYWFPAPLSFLVVAFVCFAVARSAASRESPAPR